MANTRLYTIIFVALAVISTVQYALEELLIADPVFEVNYWIVFATILILSTLKAVAVAGWYMHMVEEPRAITYLALAGVLGVVALTAGAGYSVL